MVPDFRQLLVCEDMMLPSYLKSSSKDYRGEVSDDIPRQLPFMLALLKKKNQSNAAKHKELQEDFEKYSRISANSYSQSCLDLTMFYTTNIANIANKSNENASLMIIFGFYCRMDQTYSVSFSKISLANETMSKKEFLIFCRDFNLFKLISREDAKGIWRYMEKKESKFSFSKKCETKDIDFSKFCEILVLCALFAYNKKGLKNMIHALNGPNVTAMSPKNAVEYFSHFLHLDDEVYIINFIQTVGRKTQGQLNFAGMTERSSLVASEVYEEHKEKTRKLGAKSKNKQKECKRLDTRSVGSHSLNTIETDSSNESRISFKNISIRRRFPSPDKSRLPRNLIPKLYNDNSEEDDNDTFSFENNTQGENFSSYSNDDSSSCDELDKILNEYYNPQLISLLDNYRFDEIGEINSSCVTVEGASINIGYIKPGLTLILQLKIINKSSNPVALDITASGLENSKVITHPNPLISGFRRNVTVMFSSCCLDSIGFINISYVDEKRRTHILAMPIHFTTIEKW